MTHTRSRVCRRPCCRPQPYNRGVHLARPVNDQRGAQMPRVLGFGVFLVIAALIVSAVSSDDHERNCGTPPSNAYRSAGLWYSGTTVIGAVDPYDPECFPTP